MTFPLVFPARMPSWVRLPSGRTLIAVVVSVVLVLALGLGAWMWTSSLQRRGIAAYADALVKLQQAQAPSATPEAKAQALREVEAVIATYPSNPMTAQATYELATQRFADRQFGPARTAYAVTVAKGGGDPTLVRLAQAGIGYAWEAERDYVKSAEAFSTAVAPLKAGDFLYEELLVDLARVQELAGRKDEAIKTYRKILQDPKSRRVDDVRARLATLGVAP